MTHSLLRRLGYTATERHVRNAGRSGVANERGCWRLRHTFLQVDGVYGADMIIVDPAFREQFEIPRVTARYLKILASLPAVFIGSPTDLWWTVHHVCYEMMRAFSCTGLHFPPWRRVESMLTKWEMRLHATTR